MIWLSARPPGSQVFVKGNVTPFTRTGKEDPLSAVQAGRQFPAGKTFQATARFPAPAVVTQPASAAYDLILKKVGPRVRDADEQRVIDEVRRRSGHAGRRNEIVNPRDRLGPTAVQKKATP